jgi:MFS family permease
MGRSAGARSARPRVLLGVTVVQAVLVAGIAGVGLFWRDAGVLPAGLAIGMWLLWGVGFGMAMPVRSAYINEFIPSQQRATVLSLDALFSDAGGVAGQPALGWVSQHISMPVAWLLGAGAVLLAAPFYRRSGAAASSDASLR